MAPLGLAITLNAGGGHTANLAVIFSFSTVDWLYL